MKKILIHHRKDGYLTALIENGRLVELIQDTDGQGSLVGNVYAGIVKKINTGFIFLDIGLDHQAFLDTRDSREKGLFFDGKLTVKQGDTLVVQIIKDGYNEKGPVATSNITVAGRFVVLSKSVDGDKINISKKITDSEEHDRLHSMGKTLVPSGFSAIFRTEAVGRNEHDIATEIKISMSKFDEHIPWAHVKAPATLLAEPAIIKTLREIISDDIHEIVTDCADTYDKIRHDSATKCRLLDSETPIFEHFFIKTQLDKLRDRRVWLNSGAFIIIDQTEACVVIDVNTGKSTSKQSDSAKLKVNFEAAKEIAQQLRLRNLSGIIIIDFITMKTREDIAALTDFLRAELTKDRIPTVVVGMTALGLMEMTRKRTRAAFGGII